MRRRHRDDPAYLRQGRLAVSLLETRHEHRQRIGLRCHVPADLDVLLAQRAGHDPEALSRVRIGGPQEVGDGLAGEIAADGEVKDSVAP